VDLNGALHLEEQLLELKCAWWLWSIFVGIVLNETAQMLKQSLCLGLLRKKKW